jgi:hypothetical protein
MYDQQQIEVPRADHNTPLDERIWQPWLDKNREQDKVRARRVKVLKFASAILLLIMAVFSFLANDHRIVVTYEPFQIDGLNDR